MAINFPSSPTDGATYVFQDIKYTYRDSGGGLGYWFIGDMGNSSPASTADVNAGVDVSKFVTPDALEGSKYDLGISTNAAAITALQSGKANTSGTYAGLRAQATTKDDVGLGNLPNAVSSSVFLNSSSTLATSAAVWLAYDYLPRNRSHGAVGQLTWARTTTLGGTIVAGNGYSGSSLRPYGVSIGGENAQESWVFGGVSNGGALSGTWRALGYIAARWDRYPATLFVRTS